MIDSVLSQVQRNVLYSIKTNNALLAKQQQSLATGKAVNSALDSPQNFFAGKALTNRAADLEKTLTGIKQSIREIEMANNGVEAMLKVIDQAEAVVKDALIELFPRTNEEPDAEAIQYIIDKNPDKPYFAATNNFYTNTTDFASWFEARDRASNAELTGVPEVTGHLATITSQDENDFIFNILTSSSWLGGSDDAVEGEWRWVEGPEEEQQFWQGEVAGSAVGGMYENWAPGEPNQFFGAARPENYAHMLPSGQWNDLPSDDNLNYVIEWGGDLFIQNPDINVSKEAMDYRRDYLALVEEIDTLSADATFRNTQLLQGEDMVTKFDVGLSRNSRLETQGQNFTLEGLGLTNDNFISKTEVTNILRDLQDARGELRAYGQSLQNDLSIITERRDFIEQTVNTLKSGSDDLILADMNEVGAGLLASQTRQSLQFEALSLSSQTSVLDLFA